MEPFYRPKIRLNPLLFSRLCHGLVALLFIGIYPGMIWFHQKTLLVGIDCNRDFHRDFIQYYAGAVVVRHGLWDALYPVPEPGIYDQPSKFKPVFQTPLFNPSRIAGQRVFYPPVNIPSASHCSPALLAVFPEAAVGWRYIYPPPVAVLFWPLSWFSFDFAASRIWPTCCLFSVFVMIYFSARIFRLLRGYVSYEEGLLVLICFFITHRGSIDFQTGNCTPIMAALISIAAYTLMRRRLVAFSFALIPLIMIKTLGLTWIPILLLERKYRPTILYLALLTVLLNGLVLALAGMGVYLKFFSLLPLIGIPAGNGLVPSLLNFFGFYPHAFYLLFNLCILALIYFGYAKKVSPLLTKGDQSRSLLPLAALLTGTMALYCLTNFTVWGTYAPHFLLMPFLGWILQEANLASGGWRLFIRGGIFICILGVGGWWITAGTLYHLLGQAGVARYSAFFDGRLYIIPVPLFFLFVALRRLLTNPADAAHEESKLRTVPDRTLVA